MPQTVRPESRQPYTSIIENHIKSTLGSVQARRLTVEHVERLLADMQDRRLSSSIISKVRRRLSSALKLGMRWGIVATNVAETAKAPRISWKIARIWAPADVASFLDAAAGDTVWPYWLLMVESGARTSELLGLA